jgi:hypothetical protein
MIAVKEEGDQAMAEKDEQIEEEMTRMRTEWQSARRRNTPDECSCGSIPYPACVAPGMDRIF